MHAVPAKILLWNDLRFLLSNHVPRQLANRFFGWFSQIDSPMLARASIAVWRLFADLDLSEARTQRFRSLHACFTRELKAGARPVDGNPRVITSPCDAIVGACGGIDRDQLIQAKGFPYKLQELLLDPQLVERYRDGQYVTLRLTPTMYHRFHAPFDCIVDKVTYVSGDTWNVNPIALNRIPKLFCKTSAPSFARRSARPVSWLLWCRWPRFLSPVFAYIFSTPCWIRNTAVKSKFRARPSSARGKKWDGSSTGRPSSYLHQRTSRCAAQCSRVRSSVWESH